MEDIIQTPRTYLFVPATRRDRILKALSIDVDAVIVDLEDAVAEGDKDQAREVLSTVDGNRRILVRINSADSSHFEKDIKACVEAESVEGVILPMVESANDVVQLLKRLDRPMSISALVETPRGIIQAENIASSGVIRLLFGGVDYSSALKTAPSNELFAYPRARLVIASAAADLMPPVDSPTTAYNDLHQLRRDLDTARALGMGGKLCIHPSQVAPARSIFSATSDERDWAKAVLDAAREHDYSVFTFNGEMIDVPVLERARTILAS
jgi:citrate lyase subunit beta/citryl-CoA lyase